MTWTANSSVAITNHIINTYQWLYVYADNPAECYDEVCAQGFAAYDDDTMHTYSTPISRPRPDTAFILKGDNFRGL